MYTFIKIVTLPHVCARCGRMNAQPSAEVADVLGTIDYYHPGCARWLRGVGMKALYAQAWRQKNQRRATQRGRNYYWTIGQICKRLFGLK